MPQRNPDLMEVVSRTGSTNPDDPTTRQFLRSNQASKLRYKGPEEALKVIKSDAASTARYRADLENREVEKQNIIKSRRKPAEQPTRPLKPKTPAPKRPTQRPDRGTLMMTGAKRTTRKR